MVKGIYILALTAFGSLIVHLTIIVLLPSYSANDSWNFVLENAELLEPVMIDDQLDKGDRNLMLDPSFKIMVCRYDLEEGAVQITTSGEAKFWSVAVFDTKGTVFFSGNDRIFAGRNLDLTIADRRQQRLLQESKNEDFLPQTIVAPASDNRGFALLRVFSPDPSWTSTADSLLKSMRCSALDL